MMKYYNTLLKYISNEEERTLTQTQTQTQILPHLTQVDPLSIKSEEIIESIRTNNKPDYELVKELGEYSEKGRDKIVNYIDPYGNTIMHYIYSGTHYNFSMLSDYLIPNYDMSIKDRNGDTVLHKYSRLKFFHKLYDKKSPVLECYSFPASAFFTKNNDGEIPLYNIIDSNFKEDSYEKHMILEYFDGNSLFSCNDIDKLCDRIEKGRWNTFRKQTYHENLPGVYISGNTMLYDQSYFVRKVLITRREEIAKEVGIVLDEILPNDTTNIILEY